QASNVEEAAQAAPMQAPQGGGEQAAPAPAPKNSAPAEQKRPAPIGPPVEGIDVSNHNGSINWDAVAADGKKFTFVLATDGDNFTSPSYSKQYHGAKEAGLMAGAYHFARPDDSSGREQAERFLAVADYQKDGKTLPPVLDLEVDPSTGGCYGMTVSEMQEWTREFNETVQEKTGKDAIIYANPSFWRQCMGGTSEFSDQPLWMASYGVNSPSVLSGFDDWDFWQYTDKGSVSGISGYTDLNKYQYGIERLEQLASCRSAEPHPHSSGRVAFGRPARSCRHRSRGCPRAGRQSRDGALLRGAAEDSIGPRACPSGGPERAGDPLRPAELGA